VHETVQRRRGESNGVGLNRSESAWLTSQPDHAYFGQKDIQQALLLRISTPESPLPFSPSPTDSTHLADLAVLTDLLMAHPSPDHLHILPTTRAEDNLALSSRNAYLDPAERAVAPVLHRALSAARDLYQKDPPGRKCSRRLRRSY
jgi:pantoate--beta-alanine ligase